MKKIILILLSLLVLVVGFVTFEAVQFVHSSYGNGSRELIFEVVPGSSFSRVAQALEDEQIVTDAVKFKIYAKLIGKTSEIRVGEYLLTNDMTPSEILDVISSGKSIQHTFTIPEGQNLFEVAKIIASHGVGNADEFVELFQNSKLTKKYLGEVLPSFEGYLFPETYSFTKYTTPEQVLEMMVRNFLQVWSEMQGLNTNLTRHQVVTLASVVEKETGAPEERPVIASVFHNRLEKRMRLQSDPTILYGILMQTGKMKRNIQKKDILQKTPYNTYKISALPIGPIANPGKEAIRAVLLPKQTEFLYFVSRNDGTHVFSKTYKQHNKAVREYQLNRRARKGKSWRDLGKRKGDGSQRDDL